jgi:hypothetical protein
MAVIEVTMDRLWLELPAVSTRAWNGQAAGTCQREFLSITDGHIT